MAGKKKLSSDLNVKDFLSDLYTKREKDNETDVIPTGILSLDISTGVGGIPRGKFTEIYGPESAGKTTLALHIASEAIKKDLRVLYVDVEHSVDLNLSYNIIGSKIYDSDYFLHAEPELMEDSLKLCEIAIQNNEYDLIILDSIGSLVPKKVKKDELEDRNVGLLATRLTTFIQRNVYNIDFNNIAFVGINQIRDKIGSFFSGWETPGGHAWKHILSLQIELRATTKIKNDEDVVGVNSKFVIKKNKLAPPYRTYYIPIRFGYGVDVYEDLVDFACTMGIITKAGAFYRFEDEKLGHGKVKTLEFLKNNSEILDRIKEMCYSIIHTSEKEVDKSDTGIESEEAI